VKDLSKYVTKKIKIPTTILLIVTLIFFIPIFFVYYKESVSFHFIDEYNNFLAGYFLIKGKSLYSQIFFQHQPLMAYISYIIQNILHPDSLYTLVLYHRLAVIFTALLFGLLIVFRFRFVGLSFVIIFELTKYYFFGSTFLAESFIVYPLVYLLGLAWEVLQKRKIADWEILAGAVFTWFVVFMREPYIPTAITLFAILLFPKRPLRVKLIAALIFFLLSISTLVSLPLKDYLFELTTVNIAGVAVGEIQRSNLNGMGIISIFIYPLLILIKGMITYIRGIEIILALIFLSVFYVYVVVARKWKNGLLLLFILGISNLRIEEPGKTFFGAYHMLVWYSLFVMSTLLLVKHFYRAKIHASFRFIITALLIFLIVYLVLPANELLWNKQEKLTVFSYNYGQYYVNGEVIRILADSQTTVFVDGWDSLLYWQADQPISFPFLFYYQSMDNFTKFTDMRAQMFRNNPPEFVYSPCSLHESKLITDTFKEYSQGMYEVFYVGESPTCLFIRKSAINTISKTQWDKIKPFGYTLRL
jgi:hypothetical protein